ncbi:hypothetical protein [Flavobacterium haoranii]|uniref:Uncharacterized protein n=1 Tax=Flavobacterium haoranii TaxID=683124 RepID=A0A1M6H396_9FLAO|nr:hypothetical protein [Flavobacterium haoranii]SHJ16612.1 hypothetical protein SAMN05444337_1416 [Flavobacterium haoranii]
MKNKIIFFILFSILFSSCESDPIEANIQTTVQGVIFDNVNQEPIVNQELIISEYKKRFVSDGGTAYDFIQNVGSTITDSNGNYHLTFSTSGKGDYYTISPSHNNLIWNYYQDKLEIGNIGSNNVFNYNFLKLYPCILTINTNNIQNIPLHISHFLTLNSELSNITEYNGTETRTIYIDKNTNQEVKFYRNITPNNSQIATIVIPATNINQQTTFEINLSDSDFQ